MIIEVCTNYCMTRRKLTFMRPEMTKAVLSFHCL